LIEKVGAPGFELGTFGSQNRKVCALGAFYFSGLQYFSGVSVIVVVIDGTQALSAERLQYPVLN
jgi:hypothetical protein